jgi:hypothetical protein
MGAAIDTPRLTTALLVAIGIVASGANIAKGATQAASPAKTDPWYAKHALYGLAHDLRPTTARIDRVVAGTADWPNAEWRPSANGVEEINCERKFKHSEADFVASLKLPGPLGQEALFAVVLPTGDLLAVGGNRKRMPAAESQGLAKSLGPIIPPK